MAYYVFNTSDINAIKTNARLYSAKGDVTHNGVLGQVGALQEGHLEVRDFEVSTAETIANQLPMVTMLPEVNYDNARRSQNAIGNFVYPTGHAFTVIPLEAGDAIELSEDYFGEALVVGDIVTQAVGGGYEKAAAAPASSEAKAYFVVVGERKSGIYQAPFGDGVLSASNPTLYTLELVLA